MKNLVRFITVLLVLAALPSLAQTRKLDTITIKTSAECEQCKKSIEKALVFEKGVKSAKLNVETKEVEVVYKPSKITPDQIRQAISNAGYDADDKKANNKAYQKLEECCKKGGMDHHK